jgi:N6-adenosine-specific RNA methylase IME4|tara:strand:+ start:4064 stop:4630 length:567 start_codon:yes stop_codon:yes gene_type:complete
MEFPTKKYNIILADPPWTYDDKCKSGDRGLGNKYDTMSIPQLMELPVETIAVDDCFLFMWVTYPLLQEGFQVMKAWGFEYKTVAFTWIKETSNCKVFMGMGNYTRSNPELVILGKKGKPNILSHSVENYTRSKIGKHSQKPDIIRKKIVQLCGDLPRIELFSRTKIHGWSTWGNDEKLDDKPLESFFE